MEWLNYHHLLYFWMVAREGSVTRAGEKLRLRQPTLSGQIRALEQNLGEKLFERRGRGLALTEMGRVVQHYADEIFTLGHELQEAVRGRSGPRTLSLAVGVADVVPKLVAYRLIRPATEGESRVRVLCREDGHDTLLAALSLHELDVVLTDAPLAPGSGFRVYAHLLGECEVSLFGSPALARKVARRFPRSLDGAPLLLPLESTSLRRTVEHWLGTESIRPQIAGEFEDSALLKTFGQAGVGLFFAPSVIAREVQAMYGVKQVARIPAVRERFYAITAERRIKHPVVSLLMEVARGSLFS